MSEKQKNSLKIPIYIKLTGLAIIVIPLLLISFLACKILQNVWAFERFLQTEPPFVQEAIREQCLMPEYIADGYFDDSAGYPPPYYDYDRLEDSSTWIRCYKDGEFWHCSCGEP